MSVQEHLQQLLDREPDVSLAAFGDLSSALVLNWAARVQTPREVLDVLGGKAATSMALLHPGTLPSDVDPAMFGTQMVRFTSAASEIFARPDPASEDVTCVVCNAGVSLGPILQAAADLARAIDGAA